MSDAFVRLIPTDPLFVPPEDAQTAALKRLGAALPSAGDVNLRVTDEVCFVDAGANFEAASCPLCRAGVDLGWWGGAVDSAAERDFVDLATTMPCCGEPASLNELLYEAPQGFARFVIEAMNPGVDELPETVVDDIVHIVGRGLRVIWAHY